MFSSLGSNSIFNEIEYFTFLTLWFIAILLFFIAFYIYISSSLLLLSSTNFNDCLLELFLSIIILLFLILVIAPSLTILFDIEIINIPLFIFYSLGYQWAWIFNLYGIGLLANYYLDHYSIPLIQSPSGFIINQLGTLSFNYSMECFIYSAFTFKFDVNSFLIIPLFCSARFFVFSVDVIHSMGFYAFGIKIDALPGRSVAIISRTFSKGEHRGFCFELCGQGHSSMYLLCLTASCNSRTIVNG